MNCRHLPCWLLALALSVPQAVADEITRAQIDAWLWQADVSTPPPAGTVIGRDRLDLVRPFVPPGYLEEFDADDLAVTIAVRQSYAPPADYRAAAARFGDETQLAADGSLLGHVAGRPFSAARIAAAPRDRAGLMVGWNHALRWQYFGRRSDRQTLSYLAAAAPGASAGHAVVTRRLTLRYHRVYLARLAWLPASGYRAGADGDDRLLYKEYVEFLEPFDVSGTRFVVERALDAHVDDQVYSYFPHERRVRRLSASERADSFMGSEFTMDDFDGFSGRVLDYTWTWLGRRPVLDVIATGEAPVDFGGRHGRAPLGAWQLRDCHVVELVPVWPGHPFGRRLLLVDAETFDVAIALAFDRADRLWRIFDPVYHMPASEPDTLQDAVPLFRAQVSINRVSGTATLGVVRSATLHPALTRRQIERLFDVSSLNAGR